jgi:hypothetical protein
MTTKTTTTRRASKASERPPMALMTPCKTCPQQAHPAHANATRAKPRPAVRCLCIVNRLVCCLPALQCLTMNAL